ncbi:MAG: hypothetical protein ACLGI8_08265 [Acidimicrobiia bacterium]
MPHVMIPTSPFRRASIPDPHPPQPPLPDPAPEPGPSPLPDPDPTPVGGDRPGDPVMALEVQALEPDQTPDAILPVDVYGAGDGDGGDDSGGDGEQADPGGDSDPHPPLPEPGAAA